MDLDALSKGISLKNKRKWEKDEPKPEPDEKLPAEPKQPDLEQLLRQERLTVKYSNAKTINYSGFAVNGGSIIAVLYGVDNIFSDPATLEMLELMNTTFKLDIDFPSLFAKIEEFKAHIVGVCVSVQTTFAYYQDICGKLKAADREDIWTFINEEIGKVI